MAPAHRQRQAADATTRRRASGCRSSSPSTAAATATASPPTRKPARQTDAPRRTGPGRRWQGSPGHSRARREAPCRYGAPARCRETSTTRLGALIRLLRRPPYGVGRRGLRPTAGSALERSRFEAGARDDRQVRVAPEARVRSGPLAEHELRAATRRDPTGVAAPVAEAGVRRQDGLRRQTGPPNVRYQRQPGRLSSPAAWSGSSVPARYRPR